MATLQSPRYIAHFTSLKTVTNPTASYRRTLPPSSLHLRIRRRMASSTDAADAPADGNPESSSDVLVQYVVLRRDLIDTWPLGSVVTQGCHASVAAIWSHKDDPHTIDYCSPTNLDSMHKASSLFEFCEIFINFYTLWLSIYISVIQIEECTVFTSRLLNISC